jgi:hypothetical protein
MISNFLKLLMVWQSNLNNLNTQLVGGAITILKNMSSSMGRMTSHIYKMENKIPWLKPPTSDY